MSRYDETYPEVIQGMRRLPAGAVRRALQSRIAWLTSKLEGLNLRGRVGEAPTFMHDELAATVEALRAYDATGKR